MKRTVFLVYGLLCYLVFLAAFLYAIGFVGNLVVPKTIDADFRTIGAVDWLINIVLLGLFAVQHSMMARPGFKAWWTRIIPPQIERNTFVLFGSCLLFLLFWQWRPITTVVWSVESEFLRTVLHVLFWAGWALVLISTFLIDHFDLFGVRQAWYAFQGKEPPPVAFVTRGLYRYIRHPIMLGFLIAFWATPDMTQGHLLFAVLTSAYILVGITLEERDLRKLHPEHYETYRRQTSMLIPGRKHVAGG